MKLSSGIMHLSSAGYKEAVRKAALSLQTVQYLRLEVNATFQPTFLISLQEALTVEETLFSPHYMTTFHYSSMMLILREMLKPKIP